jgi:hypothetical protein
MGPKFEAAFGASLCQMLLSFLTASLTASALCLAVPHFICICRYRAFFSTAL